VQQRPVSVAGTASRSMVAGDIFLTADAPPQPWTSCSPASATSSSPAAGAAGAGAARPRPTEELPPKYGTPQRVDMATLQGRSRRESAVRRLQRQARSAAQLREFEAEHRGFVAELGASAEAQHEAARQR
jgi:hypothetical protein